MGSAVLTHIFEQADAQGLALRVGALRDSRATLSYQRHGFVRVEQAEFDNYYLRAVRNTPTTPPRD